MKKFDFIIIGSGIAGLNFALNAAEKGRVLVLTKKQVAESSTNYAQGGISAVLDKADSFQQHVEDTMKAGGGYNDRKAVEFMVKNAPAAIRRLIKFGVEFDEDGGRIDLRLEGGHSSNRIVHVGDYTGKAIEEALVRRVRGHERIEVWEDSFAVDLLKIRSFDADVCVGAQIIRNGALENVFALRVVIATGGLGQIYKYTSNPRISTGDGMAMAARIGCEFRDMEFVQFHPTAFAWDGEVRFLLSEALRGEGAFLCHEDGEAFMSNYDKKGDLAPRDLVARAVFEEAKKGDVYLKFPKNVAEYAEVKFPYISRMLADYGLKLGYDFIPVMPAAHFICGGIKTNLNGMTNVKNLFAFGEVAWTGVHGANRLASNSLLEALVFGQKIVEKGLGVFDHVEDISGFDFSDKKVVVVGNKEFYDDSRKKIQRIMWENVGIVRRVSEMKLALSELRALKKEIQNDFDGFVGEELVVVLNMVTVAILVVEAALRRKVSLGGHFVG